MMHTTTTLTQFDQSRRKSPLMGLADEMKHEAEVMPLTFGTDQTADIIPITSRIEGPPIRMSSALSEGTVMPSTRHLLLAGFIAATVLVVGSHFIDLTPSAADQTPSHQPAK